MKETFEFKMLRRGAAAALPGKSLPGPDQETRGLTNPVPEEVRSQAMGHVNGSIYERSYRNQIVDADIISTFPETSSDEAIMIRSPGLSSNTVGSSIYSASLRRSRAAIFDRGNIQIVPNYYRILLMRARQQPGLQLAPKSSPEDGLGWQELPVTHLAVAAMDNSEPTAADTEVAQREPDEEVG